MVRVTPQATTARTLLNLERNQAKLARLQDQVGTGKRILQPSDDPSDYAAVRFHRAEDLRFDQHIQNIADTQVVLQHSVDSLTEVRNILTRASTIASEANTGAIQPATVQVLANEVDHLLEETLRVANTRLADGRYVFGGTASDETPFEITARNAQGLPSAITYRGALDDADAIISTGRRVKTLLSGDRTFQSRDRGATTFTGHTGAAAGTGTSNGRTNDTLVVAHTLTTYAGASGIAAGASSVAGDTVLGPAGTYSLAIDDVNQTLQLSGPGGAGPLISYSAETDLLVTGQMGAQVFVDTSGIVAGFVGSVNITGDGTLSTDGGATTAAIDFTNANQLVTDSDTGAVTYVNSTGIRRTGSEYVEYQGTYDVFELLMSLRDELRNYDNFSAEEITARLTRRIAEVERLTVSVGEVLGEQANSAENAESLRTQILDIQAEVQDAAINLEDANPVELIMGLQSEENLFQFGLAVAARVNNLSLLDFLQ